MGSTPTAGVTLPTRRWPTPPPVEYRLCLWTSEPRSPRPCEYRTSHWYFQSHLARPEGLCGEKCAIQAEMFDHVINEHVLPQDFEASRRGYACRWHHARDALPCRFLSRDPKRWEGHEFSGVMGHVWWHVFETWKSYVRAYGSAWAFQ